MKYLLERLQKEGIEINESLKNEISALWNWGLMRISNPKLWICMVEYYRSVVPKEFFISPSSPRGDKHPPHHNRKGGLVRHLTECCILADRLLLNYGFVKPGTHEILPEARDIVLAATLVTDTFKNGSPWGSRTLVEHGEVASQVWRIVAEKFSISKELMDEIQHAVFWHYGRFTPVDNSTELLQLPPLTQIVHLLDTISAAREIDILYEARVKLDLP